MFLTLLYNIKTLYAWDDWHLKADFVYSMFAKASIFISFRKMGIEYKDDLAYNMGFKNL
jgi:hypothetical protein